MALGSDLPASRTIRPSSVCICSSSSWAARRRHCARSGTGVDCQMGAALAASRRACSTCCGVACMTWPTMSRRLAGLATSTALAGSQPGSPSPSMGQARQSVAALASRAADSEPRRCSLVRSRPAELARAPCCTLPYSSRGRGIFSCGAPSGTMRDAASTGSATSCSTVMLSSPIRLTKEVLAPFSSRRRTRYASRVSCVPTGA
ncbi:Uncharacterised protein [Bordetella pertussis]|nr:Uncharacterised protein [Bordetella pertussis]CFL93366.1 Uncharacterised protein [Bordetella pertussis]CFL99724.1 Uncharacterised protein [Bordetella pertussis]CFM44521.1 Uncharacterised protein [Bordetella pertussis]CFM98779.1 Uncharacterised protein [Bordetella pertussis]